MCRVVERMLRLSSEDARVFGDAFRLHRERILKYVLRLSGGNQALAEDVLQQVFLNFWAHRREYDLEKPLAPLLLTMAHNAWINCGKRARPSATLVEAPSRLDEPDRHVQKKELEAALTQALAALDEPVRQVFVLSRYQGLKYEEIARTLGVSVKTVEARLSRALEGLRRSLKGFLGE